MKRILVIDDDTYICILLENLLKKNGYEADAAMSGKKGLQKIAKEKYDLVLLDFRLPDGNGLEVLESIKKISPSLPVIIITAYADVRSAVKLIQNGATDYVIKPLRPDELLSLVRLALKSRKKKTSVSNIEEEFITGNSPKMKEVARLARIVAPTDMTVLIEGETGTGKEFISRIIHVNSKRKDNPFIAIDCGAVPYELANSELFGHIKGAFTGATSDKTGSFEAADGGTLFLDEIGNLSYEIQVKLLRVLQERIISRLGENKNIEVDVRIIAASNKPLKELVESGKFRMDLYHRINEFNLKVPSLRERAEDIMLYAKHFLELSNHELEKSVKGFSPEAIRIFERNSWSGNLRELHNMVRRSVLLSREDYVGNEHLPEELLKNNDHYTADEVDTQKNEINLKEASNQVERQVIIDALYKANFNKSKAAKILNIDRKTLYNKINKFEIDTNNI